ncbi:MAG: protein tyrosine phosphatase family protein [Pseudomonadales bacterium]
MNKLILSLLIFPLVACAGDDEVPFGDRVNESIVNYNRTTPYIATSGNLDEGSGVEHVKELGFRSILDLRTPPEGVETERQQAESNGLKYLNISVGKEAPPEEDLDRFQQWVENSDNYPTLVHCASANRAGALWAMYRLRKGIPLDEAILEGRTIGMKESREPQVVKYAEQLTAQ